MDYQGNTDKSKELKGEKQVEKVVTGEVIRKPEPIGRKFKNIFFGGDVKSAGKFVWADVMLPAFRDLLVDAIINGAKGVIYGESRYRRRDAEYRPRVSYNNPVTRIYPRGEPRDIRPSRAYLPDQPHRFRQPEKLDRQDVILARKEDAEVVVERLIDIIDKFEVASLADFYDLVGLTSSHIDNKWGWTYLGNADIRQTRDGYVIDLPPLEAI